MTNMTILSSLYSLSSSYSLGMGHIVARKTRTA